MSSGSYSVSVREHLMIAHSLKGEVFGPAQRLHGATLVVDLEVYRAELDRDDTVVDIGRLGELLRAVLAPLSYRNLDELPELAGRNTTVELLAGELHRRVAARIAEGALGGEATAALTSMRVTVHESHVAHASYQGPLARSR